MSYIKSTLTLFVLFIILQPLSAQKYRSGFIVTHENDTIRGEIQYRSYTQDFVSCRFRKGNSLTDFSPAEIQAFGYDGGKLMMSGISEGSFVETLVQGTLSLFTTEEDQLYVAKDGESYHLERKFVKTVIDGQQGVKEDRRWQGILSILISDCIKNSNEAVSNIKLLEKSLINLARRYNRCKGDAVPDEKVSVWTGVEIGLSAGLGRLSFDPSFNSTSYDPTTVQVYRTLEEWKGTGSFFGMFLDITFPNISNVFSLHTELILTEFSGSTEGDLPTGTMSTDAELTALQVPLGTRAAFPQKGFVPFFDLGLQLDLERESTTSHQVRPRNFGRARTVNNSFEIHGNAIGLYVGVGMAIPTGKSRAAIHVRYTRKSQGSNDQGDLSLGANQWYFTGTFSGLIHRKPKE